MFARGSRAQGRHARGDRARRGQPRPEPEPAAGSEAAAAGPDYSAASGSGAGGAGAPPAAAAGPYDSSEAPAGVRRLDLGSLKIPSVTGVEVRVQANQEGVVQQVILVHQDSLLQLGVFAAPRSERLWDEIRGEIRQTLVNDGVTVEEIAGDYGTELRARVRTAQGGKELRFVGIDGPRWMVRAVFQGPAAVDAAKAGPLLECLRGLVVERGGEARPVKEPLPLRLSEEMAAQLQQRAAAADATPGSAAAPGPQVNGGPAQRRPSPRPHRD